MKVKRYIISLFILIHTAIAFGQDIHFSQFDGSLLNLSPGFTGLFNGDYRVGAIYRSQWQTVPVKYSTFSMSGEMRLKPVQLEKDMVGIGITFNNDRAGDAYYGTTQLYASGSYIFLLKPDSSFLISVGATAGWCQVGFDYSKMTFDNQFDGFQYSRGNASGESFNYTRRSFADISVGAAAQYILNHKHRFIYGVGFQHITSPRISYQGNDLSRLDYKLTNYLSYCVPTGERTDVIGEALISNQGRNYELIPQASLKFYFNRPLNQSVSAGACFRTRDAVIARLGYTNKTLQSGIAYDLNISKFNAATNRRGAFEIFLNYVIRLKPAFIARKRACPLFM